MKTYTLQVREQITTPYPIERDAVFYAALDLICEDVVFTAERDEDMEQAANPIIDAYERRSPHLSFTVTCED